MKNPTIEDLIEKISALEKRVEALEGAKRSGGARASSSAGTRFSAGNEEMTLVILAEGRPWKSGAGHFYFSKKDGTEDCGSVGISLSKIGGQPLSKGMKIRITTSKVEDDNYNGESRFQCFADTCELLENDTAASSGGDSDDDFTPEEPPPSVSDPAPFEDGEDVQF